ncbi:MAG: HAMP domain-containing sensor histidine kinase [Lachnospiraceae bacterium]|nr:HAMP domain-containing sensor histidine kinase [Lachnospiraceae bacterium]
MNHNERKDGRDVRRDRGAGRSGSIAWKLNLASQRRKFCSLIFTAIFIFIVIMLVWFFTSKQILLPSGAKVVQGALEGSLKKPETLKYIFTDGSGIRYTAELGRFLLSIRIPFLAVFAGALLWWAVGFLNGTESYRKYLKPIDELALAAEEISSKNMMEERFSSLEEAIEHIDGTSPELMINTGDSDLQGLEAAINNMLKRLHNSYRQQIRFVDDASHELRTPIAVIQGYINMLDRWGKSDENILEESIAAIKSEAEHMNTLVEQLLFLARGDAGRQKFEPESVDLLSMMEEIADESRMIDPEHRYELQVSEAVEIQADYAMLKQSVRILIDNAAKYSPAGSRIRIRMYTRSDGRQGGHKHDSSSQTAGRQDIDGLYGSRQVCIEIQDNGMGIGKKDVGHIFERLYRGDPARNSRTGGSGLGLSIARWIVEKHKGFFEVISYEEIGTRITIVLPFE